MLNPAKTTPNINRQVTSLGFDQMAEMKQVVGIDVELIVAAGFPPNAAIDGIAVIEHVLAGNSGRFASNDAEAEISTISCQC